jgi:hypothetical protein
MRRACCVVRLPHPGWGDSPPPGHTLVGNFARGCAGSGRMSAGSAPISAALFEPARNCGRAGAAPPRRTKPRAPAPAPSRPSHHAQGACANAETTRIRENDDDR